MDDEHIREEAHRLLQALCRSDDEALQPLPSRVTSGHWRSGATRAFTGPSRCSASTSSGARRVWCLWTRPATPATSTRRPAPCPASSCTCSGCRRGGAS